jgi:hypothetical protein
MAKQEKQLAGVNNPLIQKSKNQDTILSDLKRKLQAKRNYMRSAPY